MEEDIETVLKPAVITDSESDILYFNETLSKYSKLFSRLKVVRRLKDTWRSLEQSGEFPVSEDNDTSSVYSEYTSYSTFSNRSTTSSLVSLNTKGNRKRTTKKKKKKRVTNKEGGPYEEEYLCHSMRTLIPNEVVISKTSDLIKMLLFFGEINTAKSLQSSLKNLILLIESSKEDMLKQLIIVDTDGGSFFEQWSPNGSSHSLIPTLENDVNSEEYKKMALQNISEKIPKSLIPIRSEWQWYELEDVKERSENIKI